MCAFSGAPLAELPSLISTPVGTSPASSSQWVGGCLGAETGCSLTHSSFSSLGVVGGFPGVGQLSHPRPMYPSRPLICLSGTAPILRDISPKPPPPPEQQGGSPLGICSGNALVMLLPSQDGLIDIFLISCSSQPVSKLFCYSHADGWSLALAFLIRSHIMCTEAYLPHSVSDLHFSEVK